MDMNRVKAIITGGASGLGEATARHIAASGGKVAIFDLNEEKGAVLAEELGGEAVSFHKTDVSSGEDMQKNVAAAKEAMGGLNIVVNCAGIGTPGKLLGRKGPHALETFERVIQVNLIGTFNVIRLAAEAMTDNEPGEDGERGVIINTASVAAFEGQIGQVAYSASKGGVAAMTLPIARELAAYGIRVMTIAPGLINTPMFDGLPDAARESLEQMVPFPQRLGHPEEYARLVEAIVTNRMLNGEVIRLDGGIRMQPR
ncbi:3-hydroxyacyl-CoA dehydrogenase [Edaphobacillus lindanitolerans]|uniref:NAD(P)-dependent dehydrogenase, short-chain alcohol dehydrogenase family n=1 Tax=Edaphobacillus lindanitolerans TaxID=550447 RepID=A0A1U7PNZ9_9BACI|nr:3-hydroxyacyl-CoA dehydrogenase [Edaphobacillus lindanitolerans]SIT74924.1 NAD(P)-dependent dehydrogenase, short-chain alcohol dehydrogenase family [Edaphobacillus lindanitolerans]